MLQRPTRRPALRVHVTPLAVTSLLALACSAPPGLEDADGPPEFAGSIPTAGQAPTPAAPANTAGPGNTAAPGPSSPAPASSGEQNPAAGAPIAPSAPSGTDGNNSGAGGSSMVAASEAGAGGSSMGIAGGPGQVISPEETPPGVGPAAPNDPSPEDIATFFASLPCGAQYTALGDGGWQFCLRLADGGAACTRGSAAFQRVTFAGGGAVTDVAQVSGQRDSGVGVVTTAGALHVGGVTSIDTTPLIPAGVVSYSGGFHASVALVEQGNGFGISSWTDNGAPAPVTLPGGAQPIQVSANYGLACALSTAGDVYCWNAGGNHSLQLADTPTLMPMARALQMISVGQNSVCGVSFDETLECQAAWYDSPFLPTEGAAPDFQIRQSTFPAVRSVHVGFGQGIVVRSDGTAAFLASGTAQPPADNPGQPFTGVSDIVAAGGDRGSACVLTSTGSVFCRADNGIVQATLEGAPLSAQAAACPL